MFTIAQQIILGIIQGITEWLPISSSAMITLIMANLYGITNIGEVLHAALFLHLGTFLAALIYFRKDVKELTYTLFNYKYGDDKSKKTLKFLIIATLISGLIGLVILEFLTSFESSLSLTGKTITLGISILLLFTGVMQIKIKKNGTRVERNISNSDGIISGIAQGLASLPGVSRSGITVSTLLLKNFDDTTALRLSFLMSLPIVLAGNILLNMNDFAYTNTALYGLVASFIFGILSIHGLMKISKKINFGYFILVFAGLMLISTFL